jgi:hypothetical protein
MTPVGSPGPQSPEVADHSDLLDPLYAIFDRPQQLGAEQNRKKLQPFPCTVWSRLW